MEGIRDSFHGVLNSLNQISVSTVTTVELVKEAAKQAKTDPDELNKLIDKTLEALEDSNKSAIEAAVGIKKLKERIYERLSMNSEGEC